MKKVVLYDTQPVRAKGFESILRDKADVQLVRIAEFLEPSILAGSHVAIITDSFSDEDIIRFLPIVKELAGVIVLDEQPVRTRAKSDAMIRLGVHRFGSLNSPPEILVELIEAVARGENDATHIPVLRGLGGLSPRELQVVQLIGEGLKNKEIAERLSVALDTVKAHLTNIFGKVGCTDRLELAILAREKKVA